MWLYSAAAVVALLLAVGLGWLLLAPGTTNTAGQLATTAPAVSTPKKDLPTQATAPQGFASTSSEAPVATAPSASAAQSAPLASHREAAASRMVAATTTSARPAPAAVATLATPKARPERLEVAASEVAVAAVPATLTTTQVPTRPIEVEVVREMTAPVLAAVQTPASAPQQRSRLGAVLRQARNAVVGDPVDLQQVGLPETLTVQARVAGHQLNKTIQL